MPAYPAYSATNVKPIGTIGQPVSAQTASSTGSTPAYPPMPIVNQINAFKTTYETAKAAGASQTSLDQISGAASNYRKQNGIRDDDQRFGTEAGVYTPPMPQEQPTTNPDNPPPTAAATTTTPAATGATPQYGMTPDQIAAEAKARIDRMIADKTRVSNQTKASLDTSFNRWQQDTTDNRTLENVQNERQLSPFSGRSDYAQGMIARERGRTDREMSEDLLSRKGNVDAQLNDFLNAAPEQQQEIINQLSRIERDYNLQVGQLTGTFGGQQTLAARNSDRQFGLDEGALTGVYGGQQTAAQRNADRGFGLQEGSLTGSYGGERTLAGQQFDRGALESDRNYNRGVLESDRTYDYQKGRDQTADNQWRETFDFTKDQSLWDRGYRENQAAQGAQQFAQQMGYNWAELGQREKQMLMTAANQQQDNTERRYTQNFNQGMEIFKSTGIMPSYMGQFGVNVEGLNDAKTKEKVSVLYSHLTDGKSDPKQLLQIINGEEQNGISTPEEAAQLRKTIYQFDPSLDPSQQSSGGITAGGSINAPAMGAASAIKSGGNFGKTLASGLAKLFGGK